MASRNVTGRTEAGDLKISAVAKTDAEELVTVTFELTLDQASFFKGQTGIYDDEALKEHILEVQQKAYKASDKIFPFACIRIFTFLEQGIATQPEYRNILKLGQERPDGILLDIGCCFGVDARKAIADGFPLRNVVTSDLNKDFFDLGHALFRTTPASYPLSFVPGDAFDPKMLQIVPPFDIPPSSEKPDLSTLTSLNPLAGRCAVIFASNFFHLFSEENQFHLAKALAGLLSPEPGSMICGEHVGNWEKGLFRLTAEGKEVEMFQDNPESWCAVWDRVFTKGQVRTEVKLDQHGRPPYAYNRLQWSVVRL